MKQFVIPKVKKLFVFLLILLSANNSNASERDSLNALLQNVKPASADLAKLQLQIGLSYYMESNTDSAIIWFEPSSINAQKLQLSDIYTRAETNLGNCYADKGNNPLALNHYQNALKQAELIGNKKYIANIQQNIGALHLSWKNFKEAINYYNKAEKTAIELKDSNLLADCYNNKGTVYEQLEDYPAALQNYSNALQFYELNQLDDGIAMSSSNLAIVYKLMGNYDKAIEFNGKALAISQKIGDDWMSAAILNNIGNLYGQQSKFLAAKLNCEKALQIARKIDAKEIVVMVYESLAEAAFTANENKLAYNYMKLFVAAKDSFISAQQTQQFKELEVKYDTEKKELDLNAQKEQIKKQQLIILITILLAIAILLLAISHYKRYKEKKESEFKKQLQAQEILATQAVFDTEQQERVRIARDLHDSIGQMLSVVKMNLSGLKTRSQIEANQQLVQTEKLVDNTIEEVRQISHNLIPQELNMGLVLGLEELSEQLNKSSTLQVNINVVKELQEIKFAKAFELSVYRITQEVLNNMIKHAQASIIEINMQLANNQIVLSITDNGKGFDTSTIEKATGIGWKNIKARVNLLSGEMQVVSAVDKGTHITIKLPQQ